MPCSSSGQPFANAPTPLRRRNELFALSGSQNYPQFFLAEKLGTTSFLGDFGILDGLHDASSLPQSVLDANPSLVTLERVMAGNKKFVFLSTTYLINPDIARRQERAIEILASSGIEYETVDGSNPEMKTRRDELFKISGRRGVYPQFFVLDDDVYNGQEDVSFIGEWDDIEQVNDASGLPQAMLEAHPSIKTWDAIIGPRVVDGVGICTMASF